MFNAQNFQQMIKAILSNTKSYSNVSITISSPNANNNNFQTITYNGTITLNVTTNPTYSNPIYNYTWSVVNNSSGTSLTSNFANSSTTILSIIIDYNLGNGTSNIKCDVIDKYKNTISIPFNNWMYLLPDTIGNNPSNVTLFEPLYVGASNTSPGQVYNVSMSADGTYILGACIYYPNYGFYLSQSGTANFNTSNLYLLTNWSGNYSLDSVFVSPTGQYMVMFPFPSFADTYPIFFSNDYGTNLIGQKGLNITASRTPQVFGQQMAASSYNGKYLIILTNGYVGWSNNGTDNIPTITPFFIYKYRSSIEPYPFIDGYATNGLAYTTTYNSVCMDSTGQYTIITNSTTIYYSSNTNASSSSNVSFNPVTNISPVVSGSNTWLSSAMSADGKIIICAANTGVYISSDGGSSSLPSFTKLPAVSSYIVSGQYGLSMSYCGQIIVMCSSSDYSLIISVDGGLSFNKYYFPSNHSSTSTGPTLQTTSYTNSTSNYYNSSVCISKFGNLISFNLTYATGNFVYFYKNSTITTTPGLPP